MAYVTTADSRQQFAKESFDFGKAGSMSPNQIRYDKTALADQSVDGFGLAVTTSSCYNLLKMSQADRTAFSRRLSHQRKELE